MCGRFRVIRGDERLTVSRARHAHGSACTLYKTFVRLKMGSVSEMVRWVSLIRNKEINNILNKKLKKTELDSE